MPARGVGIVGANFSIRRVTVDHGVHVARGHAEKEVRLTERAEGIGALPIGLVDDADPEPLRLQRAANNGHAKTGVVNVCVTGHDDDVAAVPPQGSHFHTRRWQELSRAKSDGPIGTIAGDGFRESLELRNVDRHVHRATKLQRGGIAANRVF